MKKLLAIWMIASMSLIATYAAEASVVEPIDSVRQQELWQQEDFVRAYYVIAEPGGKLYSVFGHACLHMVCPAYGLDYIYSYESENAAKLLLKFFSGRLQMGMLCMTPAEYMEEFAAQGRGVKEYELNLPIAMKRELWRVLDEKTAEGMWLPYDFEARGCAYSCMAMLEEALGETKIDYGEWSSRFNRTRREIANDYAAPEYPWDFLVITSVVGAEYDRVDTITEKLLVPVELAEVWQHAKVNGEYLLSREAHELLPSVRKHTAPLFTPMWAAMILLVLAILGCFTDKPYIDYLLLGIVTLIGLAETYLVVFSTLPCTQWHWLLIPFNLLPAICWKWRKYWALPYAVVIGLWSMCMLALPHQLVDYSMVVTAVAFMIVLIHNEIQINTNKK